MGRAPQQAFVLATIVSLACVTAPEHAQTSNNADAVADAVIVVDEITGPVAPPGPGVVDAAGERQLGASSLELQAAGHFYYRAGELDRAWDFYSACFSGADGELRAACLWALGAVLVAEARRLVADGLHEDEGCVRRNPPAPLECTEEAHSFESALSVLRIAHRGHSTARRAFVIGALYERLGNDAEALRFYEQGLALEAHDDRLARSVARLRLRGPRPACPSCPPQPGVEEYRPSRPTDCPSLPFGFHRGSDEREVVGSGLEGLTRERVLACMGQPRERSTDSWSYVDFSCTVLPPRSEPDDRWRVTTTVRLYFEADVVVRVTHQRIIGEHGCMMLWAD